jgi:putative flippase GtrA
MPVFNEAHVLEPSLRRLHRYLDERFPFRWRITIADNDSTDDTWTVAQRLCAQLPHVWAVRVATRGRGGALREAWATSDAQVVAYMDVDLSTDLDALLPLVAPLVSGHSDIAVGSRLSRGARVRRGPKRELISRCYNLLLRTVLRTRVRDAQCGFKAVRATVARSLLPAIEDNGWFFDTELLVLGERVGLRIVELPVDWVDDADSRVDLWRTALEDLRGIWRVLRRQRHPGQPSDRPTLPEGMRRQLFRFALIGVASTVGYAALFTWWRPALGPWLANVAALAVTMVGNTVANRRWTFGRRGRRGAFRELWEGSGAFLVALAVSTAALVFVRLVTSEPAALLDLAALLAAGLLATAVRFLFFRGWVFHPVRLRRRDQWR